MSRNPTMDAEIVLLLQTFSKQDLGTLETNSDLFSSGVLDSFGIIEFVVSLERHFQISIPQQELIPQNFWSISAIAETLGRLNLGKSPDETRAPEDEA